MSLGSLYAHPCLYHTGGAAHHLKGIFAVVRVSLRSAHPAFRSERTPIFVAKVYQNLATMQPHSDNGLERSVCVTAVTSFHVDQTHITSRADCPHHATKALIVLITHPINPLVTARDAILSVFPTSTISDSSSHLIRTATVGFCGAKR